MTALLSLFLFALSVKTDRTPLKSGCDEDAGVLATLPAGATAEVRFALAGEATPCYKVRVTVDGKSMDGYLPGPALTNLDEFDRVRRDAAWLDAAQVMGTAKAVHSAGTGMTSASVGGDSATRRAVQLIEENQPTKALEVLGDSLKRHKRDPGLLAVAGVAAWRSDDSKQALEYWKESLDIQPNDDLARLYKRVQREVSSDNSNEKLYGMHFALRYEGGAVPDADARTMVAAMDEEFARVSAQVGCPATERIVAIVQSRQAYLKSTDAAEWSGAQYDGRIRVSLVEGSKIGPETRRMFAHEIVHACLASLGRWPAWLHEGLAQKISGDTLSPAARRQLEAMAQAHALPRLANLSQDWSRMSTEHAQMAYHLALKAVDVLYERYGNTAVRNLVNSPETLPQVTADLDRQLGL
jgi:Tfp pilus assembly protein PilF